MAPARNRVGGIDDPVWQAPADASPTAGAGPGHRGVRTSVAAVLGAAALLGVLAVAGAGASLLSRKDFGTFAFWGPPHRIDYCGRRYYEGGTVQATPSELRAMDSDPSARWRQVGSTLAWRPIDAVAPDSVPAGQVCTMFLYVPVGHDEWRAYPLSGGP